MAEVNGKRKKNKFFVVRNLTASPVSFRNSEETKDEYVTGYGEKALLPISDWEDSADIDKLEEQGHIETRKEPKRPKAFPRMPVELEPEIPLDRSTAVELATMDNQEIARLLIEVEPETSTTNVKVSKQHRHIDLGYLRSRHRAILRATLWAIENNPNLPEWKDERIQIIKDRLDWIDNIKE